MHAVFNGKVNNNRSMGHIAHLRKQIKLINTYDYIITVIKRRKKHTYYENVFFIWRNLNPLKARMFFAKFGWNWPKGSAEEDENVKNLQTNRQTGRQTDDGRQVIRNAQLSFQLRWAKNSDTLIKLSDDSIHMHYKCMFNESNVMNIF